MSIKKSSNSAFKAEADVTAFLSWWVCEDEWELFYNLEIWDLLPTQEENSVYGLWKVNVWKWNPYCKTNLQWKKKLANKQPTDKKNKK